ncbi:MAG: hypothetical protein H0U46_07200 [Actinobacteria bacterium]|nr:hypothetical protein [Actinomycetota bacterium]
MPEDTVDSGLTRRVLAHASSPEEKLERLLAERSRDLEEQAARFDTALGDLERREGLLRDMRASVERTLRLGSTDLRERETELEQLDRDISERRSRLAAAEGELDRRRRELGAVELKREAVEQRERALAAREEQIEAKESDRLADLQSLQAAGAGSADQAGALGGEQAVELLFVPGTAYALVEIESRTLRPGALLELDGESYVVSRLGPSPLPGATPSCAYLERVPGGSSDSGGSS